LEQENRPLAPPWYQKIKKLHPQGTKARFRGTTLINWIKTSNSLSANNGGYRQDLLLLQSSTHRWIHLSSPWPYSQSM